jgi:hypothetical protein
MTAGGDLVARGGNHVSDPCRKTHQRASYRLLFLGAKPISIKIARKLLARFGAMERARARGLLCRAGPGPDAFRRLGNIHS